MYRHSTGYRVPRTPNKSSEDTKLSHTCCSPLNTSPGRRPGPLPSSFAPTIVAPTLLESAWSITGTLRSHSSLAGVTAAAVVPVLSHPRCVFGASTPSEIRLLDAAPTCEDERMLANYVYTQVVAVCGGTKQLRNSSTYTCTPSPLLCARAHARTRTRTDYTTS